MSPTRVPLLPPEPDPRASVAPRFARGVLWSGVSTLGTSGVRLLVIATLARLLTPSEFGLFTLTLLLIDLGNDLGDFGLGPAVIQRQNVDQAFLTSVFWATLAGGAGLFLVAAALAPALAWFFHQPLLRALTLVAAVTFIIRAASFVHRALLQKALEFNRLAVVEIGSTVAWGVTSIALAWLGAGVWALVWGLVAHRIADVAIAWRVSPFRPSRGSDLSRARDVFGFAARVTGERLTYFLSARMDYIIVGRLLGSSLLGVYSLASELTRLPQVKLSSVVSSVAFPVFSDLRLEPDRLRTAFSSANRALLTVSFPLFGAIGLFAHELVRTCFGPRWIAAALPLQILCLVAMIRSAMHNNGAIMYAKNRPDLALRWAVIQLLSAPVPLLVGSAWGLTGVAVALALTFVCYFVYMQRVVNQLIELPLLAYLRTFAPAVTALASMSFVTLVFRISARRWLLFDDLPVLFIGVPLALSSYVVLVKVLDPPTWRDILGLKRTFRAA